MNDVDILRDVILNSDTLLIAIDFEGGDRFVLSEMGVSILDTRELRSLQTHNHSFQSPLIQNHHYRSKYWAKISPKDFHFGETKLVDAGELKAVLEATLHIDDSPKQKREIVLLGHGLASDLAVIKRLGVDLGDAPLIATLDTLRMVNSLSDRLKREGRLKCLRGLRNFSLGRVVEWFGLRGGAFHNAGNDANYALRVALLLVVADIETGERQSSEELNGLVDKLQFVATFEQGYAKHERGTRMDELLEECQQAHKRPKYGRHKNHLWYEKEGGYVEGNVGDSYDGNNAPLIELPKESIEFDGVGGWFVQPRTRLYIR
jgi:hypothetical protein